MREMLWKDVEAPAGVPLHRQIWRTASRYSAANSGSFRKRSIVFASLQFKVPVRPPAGAASRWGASFG
jgi:hypothetical protein